jgi:DNA-directed RNA polymerase subunit M/transcription elongation factor TFIIS
MIFCEDCNNHLIVKLDKLYCKTCDAYSPLTEEDRILLRVSYPVKHAEPDNEVMIVKESTLDKKLEEHERKELYEQYKEHKSTQ